MPTCAQCKFYRPRDAKSGECTNSGLAISADSDSARCPGRMYVPKA